MFRRNRAEPAPSPGAPLTSLVDPTGNAARAALDLRSAIAVVLRDVADTAGWSAGHAWGPAAVPGTWTSLGLWHPEDGIALGGLRRACVESPPVPARGHLALALHLAGPRWAGDLSGLAGTAVHEAATAAGIVAAIGCPVYLSGVPIVLLEWYLADSRPPGADAADALGALAVVLGEVAARPVCVPPVPEQGTYHLDNAGSLARS